MAEAAAQPTALPVARIVRTRAALAEAVANWPGSVANTTWALVALHEVPAAAQLAALRRAAKTCDRVAAVVLPATAHEAAKTLPTFATVVRAAGADVVWVPATEKPLLAVTAQDGSSLRLHLQALLAVLPRAVVVGKADSHSVRHWRLLQTEFGDMVDLVFI